MKQTYKIVKLFFHEPIALMSELKDEFQNEVSSLSSDMIKSAILSSLSKISNEKEVELLNEDLILSSAFLFYNNTYFFPKPMAKLPLTENIINFKKIKNIEWLDQTLFEKTINNETFNLDEQVFLQNGKILTIKQPSIPEYIYKVQTEERVSVGNTIYFPESEKGSPYYISRTYFLQGDAEFSGVSGMYFLYNTKYENLLQKSLSFLQDEGFGADRRVGNGHFKFELRNLELNLPSQATNRMILSKFIPKEENIKQGLLNQASYKLHKTSGFISGSSKENMAHWKKKSIFMIKEASLFPSKFILIGKNVVLSTPKFEEIAGHRVYREGRPFDIPVNITL